MWTIENRLTPLPTAHRYDSSLANADIAPRQLSVLHLARSVGRRACGVGAVALGLAETQRQIGIRALNWSSDIDAELAEVVAQPSQTAFLTGFARLGPERLAFSPAMIRAALQSSGASFDVLHQHGIWSASSVVTRRWRARYGRPTIIAPHGALDSWALRKSRVKKWFASRAFEHSNLCSAACLHAIAEHEVSAFRDFGLTNPIAVIANGISDDWISAKGEPARFRARFNVSDNKRILLFLSRVTPKKGLPQLFAALAQCAEFSRDWLFVVAGPDEFQHTAELHHLAKQLRLDDRLQFIGPVYSQERRDAFAASELFVLPTLSEGNPIAVFEALGAGVPVLTTTAAPCNYLPRLGCGWQADVSLPSIHQALSAALRLSPVELRIMGAAGRDFAARHLTWSVPARKTVQLYQWLLQQAERPDFVILD